jgi:hypothetical protein
VLFGLEGSCAVGNAYRTLTYEDSNDYQQSSTNTGPTPLLDEGGQSCKMLHQVVFFFFLIFTTPVQFHEQAVNTSYS